MDSIQFNNLVDQLLRPLAFRCREVFRLRSGVADGYVYTAEEIAVIFDTTPPVIEELFIDAVEHVCLSLADQMTAPETISDARTLRLPHHADPHRLSGTAYAELWAKQLASRRHQVQLVGWSAELQSEVLIIEHFDSVQLQQAMLVAVQRTAVSAEITFVGNPLAIMIRSHREGWPVLRGFFWDHLPEDSPILRYFQVLVRDEEEFGNWLDHRSFVEDMNFSLIQKTFVSE